MAAKAADSLNLSVDQMAPYLLKREEFGIDRELAAASLFRMLGCRIYDDRSDYSRN